MTQLDEAKILSEPGLTKEQMIAWLIQQPIPGNHKKYIYIEWMKRHGLEPDAKDIQRIYPHSPG